MSKTKSPAAGHAALDSKAVARRLAVKIYRSPKKVGLYLYLREGFEVDHLPDVLRQSFGQPVFAFNLNLTASTTLVQADPVMVISALKEQGYYLQLPPPVEP